MSGTAEDLAGKYARPELERRWLLARVPDGLARPRAIADRYVEGTRLRLRAVDDRAVGRQDWKLGQKVRPDPSDPGRVAHTTLYLDEAEHRLLGRALPGRDLTKVRWRWDTRGGPYSVDVFEGELRGLVMAEVEHQSAEDLAARAAPPGAIAEVSADDRFSGGSLAGLRARELGGLLADVGFTPDG